jgi:hypothetical protein
MAEAKKRKQQQSCKIMRTIDTIEEAALTAIKMYKAVEPIIKAIRAHTKESAARSKAAKTVVKTDRRY